MQKGPDVGITVCWSGFWHLASLLFISKQQRTKSLELFHLMSWTFPVDRVAVLVFGRFSEGCLKPALFQPPFVLLILGLIMWGRRHVNSQSHF